MNEHTASIIRTAIKCATVAVILVGWPKFKQSHVFNQTVTAPDEDTKKFVQVAWQIVGGKHDGKFLTTGEKLPDEVDGELKPVYSEVN